MKRIGSILVFLLSVAVVPSQAEPSIAELKQQLTSARDTMKIVLLNQVATRYTHVNADSAILYGRQALALSRQQDARRYEALSLNNIGWGFRLQGMTDSAQASFDAALAVADDIKDPRLIFNCLNNQGAICEDRRLYAEAMALYQRSREIAAANKWDKGIAVAESYLAGICCQTGDFPGAVEKYQAAMTIHERLGSRELGNVYNNLGNVYMEMEQYQKADELFRKAVIIYQKNDDPWNTSNAYNGIGMALTGLQRYDSALVNLRRSLAIVQPVGDQAMIANVYGNMGIAYERLGQYDQALRCYRQELANWTGARRQYGETKVYLNMGECYLKLGRYGLAERYMTRSLALARRIEDRDQEQINLNNLSEVYQLQGRFREALSAYQDAVALKDSLVGQGARDKISELEVRYETDKKQREIDLLQKEGRIRTLELSRGRLLIGLLATGLGLLGVVLALLFQRFRHLLAFWKRKTHIGHYRIIGQIGSGGMGVVYKAAHLMDHSRPVAVKVIREELANDPVLRKRFLHEAAVIDQLDHPHIVKVFERGEYHQALFIAMELLEGRSLAALMASRQLIPLPTCCSIMSQLADAVVTIHAKGIVHRDLKPENVMLVERDGDPEYVKLLDFGLARNQALSRMTMTGEIVGTLHYLAPEQVTGQEATIASDVYSLGVIFYELVTGIKPFVGQTPIEIVKQIVEAQPLGPTHFRQDLPPVIDQLIGQMLDKEPARRPSGGDVVAVIRDCLGKERA